VKDPAGILEEPLAMSAPLARKMAAELCCRDPATGESCAWMHGFWQYLRLLGMLTTPEDHAGFYAQTLDAFAATPGQSRILVSGAADYGMLACVLRIFRSHGREPDMTMLDLCGTPLALSRWFGEGENLPIKTHVGNILEYRAEEYFDAICTHSLLGQFSATGRAELVSNWFRLLKPGGVVATVNRVRPGAVLDQHRFSAEQAALFIREVESRAAKAGALPGIEANELAPMARDFADRMRGWTLRSADEIRSLFSAAGFDVESFSIGPVEVRNEDRVSGPTTPGGAQYVCVMARRPD
jgi:SAM-dependent methyltransferase